jgi:hypothetical protein
LDGFSNAAELSVSVPATIVSVAKANLDSNDWKHFTKTIGNPLAAVKRVELRVILQSSAVAGRTTATAAKATGN